MRDSVLKEDNFGVVYTPRQWSEWALLESGVFERWLNGDSVLDPTVGDGSFIMSLLQLGQAKQIHVTKKMLDNLYGFDLKQSGIDSLLLEAKERFDINLKKDNFVCIDVATAHFVEKFDCIIGNPPWVSFAKLPKKYREELKSRFIEYGLTDSSNSLLLGSSRVDLAALIVNVAINDLAKESSTIGFFLPGSMFYGGSAHAAFRKFEIKGKPYSLTKIFNFESEAIFNSKSKHGTSFVYAEFRKTPGHHELLERQLDPSGDWIPLNPDSGSLSLSAANNRGSSIKYELPVAAKPRQGINTGGQNGIFFGTIIKGDLKSEYVVFKNLNGESVEIESKWVYPLIMRCNFRSSISEPVRYVIMCHDEKSGKPIPAEEIKKYPKTYQYFSSNEVKLRNRKGVMLNARNKNGEFWGLMGVGQYSFSPYKVVWLSAGEKELKPMIFGSWQGKKWQPNQSMQTFCPANSKTQSQIILKTLEEISSEIDPRHLGMPGTLGWGQPGKIKQFLEFS